MHDGYLAAAAACTHVVFTQTELWLQRYLPTLSLPLIIAINNDEDICLFTPRVRGRA